MLTVKNPTSSDSLARESDRIAASSDVVSSPFSDDLSKHMSKSHGEQYEEESPAPLGPPAASDDSGSQQTASSTGGVLRNLLSTPDVNQKDSLLFKTLQGGDSQTSPENDSPRQSECINEAVPDR